MSMLSNPQQQKEMIQNVHLSKNASLCIQVKEGKNVEVQ